MRISSIDIGSNAIRQIIVDIDPTGSWKILKKHRENIRLGADVFNGNVILPATQLKLIHAFKKMALYNKKFKIQRYLAIATSAFRDAKNKKKIISEIFRHSGIKIKIISGTYEAELIRLAVQNTSGLNDEKCLLLDIGGGSIELTELCKNKIYFSKSYKLGMVRILAESQRLNIKAQEHLKNQLHFENNRLPMGFYDLAIGTGGNIDALAKLKLLILKKGPNTVLTYSEIQKIYKIFVKTPNYERMSRFQIKADRVDVLEPAMYLILYLMQKYHIKKLKIPGVGLKEGAILSLL